MTTLGWIFMITFWGILIGLTSFCYIKVLKKPTNNSLNE